MTNKHSIMDGFNNCYIHPIMDGQSHPILEVNDYHPKVDGQFHPFLDVYWSLETFPFPYSSISKYSFPKPMWP